MERGLSHMIRIPNLLSLIILHCGGNSVFCTELISTTIEMARDALLFIDLGVR
jgi:hypothetical protein